MLPSIQSEQGNASARQRALVSAFDTFVAASAELQHSYAQLQQEVQRLRLELEQRNAELRESISKTEAVRRFLEKVLETSPCGIVALNPDGRSISLANTEARRLLSLPTTGEGALPSQLAVLAEVDGTDEAELPLNVEGEERWIACRFSGNLRDQHASRVLVLQDVTEIKRLEQHREATRNLVALAQLSNVLSHEIRNPLGSLELLTGLLESSDSLTSEEKQWVICMKAELRSLGCSVSNLLRLHGNGSCRKKEFNLTDFLSTAFELLLPLARKAEVLLTTTVAAGLDQLTLQGDRQALLEVLLNLTCNGFQNTPAGGQVRIAVRVEKKQDTSMLVIEVLDSGNGIPETDLSRVFEVGFSSTGRSGLGLFISRRIVAEHGGEILLRSRVGTGTTARIELPQA